MEDKLGNNVQRKEKGRKDFPRASSVLPPHSLNPRGPHTSLTPSVGLLSLILTELPLQTFKKHVFLSHTLEQLVTFDLLTLLERKKIALGEFLSSWYLF